jgi:hypothetical protein
MVNAWGVRVVAPFLDPTSAVLWAVDDAAAEPAGELDPATRATLLLALLAIIVLGIGLIAMVILGGSMVRRWARLTPPSRVPVRVPTPPPRELILDPQDDETDAETNHGNDARP